MPDPAIGTELLATEPWDAAATAAAEGAAKGFALSNAFGLASKVLTSDVAALGVLLATAFPLLASASGFGDEILKNTVGVLVAWTEALAVAESAEEELLEDSFG